MLVLLKARSLGYILFYKRKKVFISSISWTIGMSRILINWLLYHICNSNNSVCRKVQNDKFTTTEQVKDIGHNLLKTTEYVTLTFEYI